ncbi:cytochrome C peroxidase [Nostoc sp. FACHB-892]|uniref:cytochrome-c peroxidase n=1 Tax=Nostoc sp. FACHB-892 TaxID=2692843 RepID=UPI00168422AE|nr:cytochrome c peroxidase [Nostoc sp. FACHB-892]MBD2728450.1 cytochrome C peroxidase [Nostoc sp. FACHB-892]
MGKIQLGVTFVAAVVVRLTDLASRLSRRMKSNVAIAALVAIAVLAGHTVSAQITPPSQPLASLKTVPIPGPDYTGYVRDKSKAIALGKALFWDMQVGSDGKTSCATCHFHAGVDNRIKNQLNPGILRVDASGNPNPDQTFSLGGPNYTLKAADFPFHKLADVNNRNSAVISDVNDVASSQGVFNTKFLSTTPGNPQDNVTQLDDPIFNVGGIETRRVEPRNTPTTINAVYNFRNFWDGRAQNYFNGVNPFGLRDPNAKLYKAVTSLTSPQQVSVKLKNSSLASQAVGPPLSSFEMSADGRTFQDVGIKMVGKRNLLRGLKLPRDLGKKLFSPNLKPLAQQEVAVDDSTLGIYRAPNGKGLKKKYKQLIEDAFQPQWWDSLWSIQVDKNDGSRQPVLLGARSLVDPNKNTYTLMEYNFSLFFGLAIQLYESTLISDNAPIDQYFDGNKNALTSQQLRGKQLFEGAAKCINCHGGAEFTNASVKNVQNQRLEDMILGDGQEAVYDNGFYNIAVRPTTDDLGVGGKDPFGNPLSESRVAQQGKFRQLLGVDPNITVSPNQRIAADGAFKTSTLRNVELTAPYFHNGGKLTLKEVVEFYNRGGDFHEQNIGNLDADIENLNLSDQDKDDLVAFMKALTDERVRYEKAPFDHPQLFIPNGHPGNEAFVTNDGTGKATDALIEIPSVGRNGSRTPPANFLATP